MVKLLIGGAGLVGIWSKAVLGKVCSVGGGYSPLYGIFKAKQWQTLRDPCKRGGEDDGNIPGTRRAGEGGQGWQLAGALG